MRNLFLHRANRRRRPWWLSWRMGLLAGVAGVALTCWVWAHGTGFRWPVLDASAQAVSKPAGPPWMYGRTDARFTIVEYADFECPYCRDYFPVLKAWVDAHPDVNWQWHHLPVSGNEPAAMQKARLAECAGEVGGQAEFWRAAAWLYKLGLDEEGLPANRLYAGMTVKSKNCLSSSRPDKVIQNQAAEAIQQNVTATPTIRLFDHQSGKSIILRGAAGDEVLLSAIDQLASREEK